MTRQKVAVQLIHSDGFRETIYRHIEQATSLPGLLASIFLTTPCTIPWEERDEREHDAALGRSMHHSLSSCCLKATLVTGRISRDLVLSRFFAFQLSFPTSLARGNSANNGPQETVSGLPVS